MNYYIFPGSFKPPHKGHIKLLINIIKREKKVKNDNFKIIIIISNKERKLNKNSKKSINANQSLKIFKIYVNELNKRFKLKKNNIKVLISEKKSPILDLYKFIRNVKNNEDKIYLIKSTKNINNRFKIFSRIKKVYIYPIKHVKDLHSTNFRKYIFNKNYKKVNNYLLDKISNNNIKKIYKILKLD